MCITKSVHDPLLVYANYKMRVSGGSKAVHHGHKSYDEVMESIGKFDENARDIDNQFEDLIPLEMQLQDLEGGDEEGEVGFEFRAENDS